MHQNLDVFALIKKDHKTVQELFLKLEKTSERGEKTRQRLFTKLKEELTLHAYAEETAIYPLLKEKSLTKEIAFESIEEHGLVKHLLEKLASTSCATPEWTGMITVLKEMVEHHVEEEEKEMFKEMRQAFTKQELKEMAQGFDAAKEGAFENIDDLAAA